MSNKENLSTDLFAVAFASKHLKEQCYVFSYHKGWKNTRLKQRKTEGKTCFYLFLTSLGQT